MALSLVACKVALGAIKYGVNEGRLGSPQPGITFDPCMFLY